MPVRGKRLGTCPVCGTGLEITRMQCPSCETAVEGRFHACKFCRLTAEQMEFVEIFLASRGNIKEVERVLRISYPTVRARLDAVLAAMDLRTDREEDASPSDETAMRRQVLDLLERGEISADEAVQMLQKGRMAQGGR